jgi:hypothetical protein
MAELPADPVRVVQGTMVPEQVEQRQARIPQVGTAALAELLA